MILEFVCFRWVPKCCWWFAWRGQCGRGQNIVLVCKYYASLLHPGVSEPGFEPFISPDLRFSLICVVAVKIIAVVPVHACMRVCVSVTLHTPNMSVQESQPLPMNWLWNIARVYLQKCKNEIQRHAVTGHIGGDVCEDENSPNICMFVYTCNHQFSFPLMPSGLFSGGGGTCTRTSHLKVYYPLNGYISFFHWH